jgi:hypothetical protein
MWTDDKIDAESKNLLKERRNGHHVPLDMVAHLEYFYNTFTL